MPAIKTVLFDLDGTLADTAPDLAAALNHVLSRHGKPALPYEIIRPVVSHGGVALTTLGFGKDHPEFDTLYRELLDYYQANIDTHTRLFPGMETVLKKLEATGINWGIVTNKPGWLTEPLMKALQLDQRARTIVSGDTLEQRKPHPAPLLHACTQTGCEAGECVYVGDAQRDIEAGNRAGMHSVVALFGYIDENDTPSQWQADAMVQTPEEIIQVVESLS